MEARWLWPKIFAHRCGGALAPENTCAGLRVSAAIGVRAVEFDVMLSADRIPVVIHDDDLDRTTDRHGPVRALRFRDLALCDAGGRHHPAFAGEALPGLAAVATECRRLGLAANVEIKCADAEGEETGRVVARDAARLWQGSSPPPLLSSFSEVALAAARDAAPELPRALLVGEVPPDWAARVAALACVALHSDVASWSEALIGRIRAHGIWIAGYTENDPQRARRWFAAGANALFTDRPDLMHAFDAGAADRGRAELP